MRVAAGYNWSVKSEAFLLIEYDGFQGRYKCPCASMPGHTSVDLNVKPENPHKNHLLLSCTNPPPSIQPPLPKLAYTAGTTRTLVLIWNIVGGAGPVEGSGNSKGATPPFQRPKFPFLRLLPGLEVLCSKHPVATANHDGHADSTSQGPQHGRGDQMALHTHPTTWAD